MTGFGRNLLHHHRVSLMLVGPINYERIMSELILGYTKEVMDGSGVIVKI